MIISCRQMQLWSVPSPIMKALKALTREYQSKKDIAAHIKNQMHAEEHSHKPIKESLKRNQASLLFFEKQLAEIEKQIKTLVKEDDDLNGRINKVDKIEGVGFMTIVSVISETNGFALIENAKQLASYAGLDVVHNESGLKKHRTTISKKGNKRLRKAVYMPALSATRHNPKLKALYARIISRRGVKKIALIAVARKLLLLIYTIFTKNEEYNSNYNQAAC